MKKHSIIVALVLLCLLLCACAAHPAQSPAPQLTNPWKDWDTLAKAEASVGFPLHIPTAFGCFQATVFRTLEQELLEVIYTDGDTEICLRKSLQERQDISGDYTQYEHSEEQQQGDAQILIFGDDHHTGKLLIYRPGASWALLSPDGYPGDTAEDFITGILSSPCAAA